MTPSSLWTIEYYETTAGRAPVVDWLESLDGVVRHRVNARIERFEQGHFGDCKALKGHPGLFEARLHFGPGYRIYFAKETRRIVLLLCGGDKASQRKDIRAAAELYTEYCQER